MGSEMALLCSVEIIRACCLACWEDGSVAQDVSCPYYRDGSVTHTALTTLGQYSAAFSCVLGSS
jgi:hypothetical protein